MASSEQIHDLAEWLVNEGADSVFLYGSRARGHSQVHSDWELGVIYERRRKVARAELAKKTLDATVIYPFVRDELVNGIVMVPFTQSIWLTELVLTGKTLAGEGIIEQLERPEITRQDVVADASFSKARALDAMIALRTGCTDLGKDLLVKSCLLGVRDLILLNELAFPLSYEEIVQNGKDLLLDEYKPLLQDVMKVRQGHIEPTLDMAFDTLGIFSDVIEPMFREEAS